VHFELLQGTFNIIIFLRLHQYDKFSEYFNSLGRRITFQINLAQFNRLIMTGYIYYNS